MAKFTGTVYKIYHKINDTSEFLNIKDDDFTLGLKKDNPLSDELKRKIMNGITKMGAPWMTCIPLYRNSFFTFYSLESLQTFLFDYCKLTNEDFNELTNNDYLLYKLEVDAISSGLSEIRGTVCLDEIEDYSVIEYADISRNYRTVLEKTVDEESINHTKTNFYKKFKINF